MKVENLFEPDCIRTFTGLYMNVFEPTLDMICIEDIAHSLSMQCRFGGHLPVFYSVAQHSCYCAISCYPGYKLQALLHDASEAYLLDIPSPIKKRLSNYKEIEDNLMSKIAEKFGFAYPLQKPVKDIDTLMLNLEWEQIALQQNPKAFICWSQDKAKNEFLKRFRQLRTK